MNKISRDLCAFIGSVSLSAGLVLLGVPIKWLVTSILLIGGVLLITAVLVDLLS